MDRCLIIRFSAMGDVAMLVPVVHCLAAQHPELRVTVLTKRHLVPLFDWTPPNVEVKGVDLHHYKGAMGLNRLYGELSSSQFDAVADMHDVLRAKYLRMRFRLAGVKMAVIDKGRSDKKRLIGHGDTAEALRPTVFRYLDVLSSLGLQVVLNYDGMIAIPTEPLALSSVALSDKTDGERWVGIAPFAAHENKVYPLDRMRRVASLLAEREIRVFLFGAGEYERATLETWADGERIVNVCGMLGGLHNEMQLMRRLDCMVSMDSGNMHIASIVGTKVVSVWGATHPKAGFLPLGQSPERIIQNDSLHCRPCSVYGKKPCKYGDLRCMTTITPESIVKNVMRVVQGDV